jgi:hypothetical protein
MISSEQPWAPIAVQLDRVSKAMRSGDQQLIDAVIEEFGDEFEQIDEMAADYCDAHADEKPLTVREALTQMVVGRECNKQYGFVYGYTLEFVCQHFGECLPNEHWWAMPAPTRWAETVDQALEGAGVPRDALRIGDHLMHRGPPVRIPEPDDFPGIGYLKLDEIARARKALAEARLAAIEDGEVRAAIEEVARWLQICTESQRDLICFYA